MSVLCERKAKPRKSFYISREKPAQTGPYKSNNDDDSSVKMQPPLPALMFASTPVAFSIIDAAVIQEFVASTRSDEY